VADPSIHAELAAIREQISRHENSLGRLAGAFEGLRDHRNEQVENLGEDADKQRDATIGLTGRLVGIEARSLASQREVDVLTKRVEEVETVAEKVSSELALIRALANQPWKWAERAGILVAIATSIALAWATIKALPPQPAVEQHQIEPHK
jgi:archaellum component FlaC